MIEHRRLAAIVVAFALVMKALLPAGYMVGQRPGQKVLTVLVCADASGDHLDRQVSLPISGQKDGNSPSHDVCPFAGHAFAALGGADPIQIALAILFVLALGFAPAPLPRLAHARHVLPPPCGPPACA
ncbi:hypothetical protein [Novosphingobium sp. UBA1939]|uniref:hypothetical protein n=1 Tax=Novosphingobium sp. UBA1939 TaxID=1946982 RepID=UPI0025CCC40D|nr:hypothetical protein [Novosphingobium sp. UBA1939]